MTFHRPTSLAQALVIQASGNVRILAGGTDIYPALRDQPVNFPLLDVTAIKALRHIRRDGAHWSIGAATTWTDIIRAKLPKAFDALKLAAREVGSIQIQNRATIAGNLCNASPAADGVPPLLALDAEIELASRTGTRREMLSAFIKGNRKTSLRPGEIVTRILVPAASSTGQSAFLKLGARKYLVISIAMVAARVALRRNRIAEAAIAVGSCSEVATRLPEVERLVIGLSAKDVKHLSVEPESLSELAPITDVRATADYRTKAAIQIIRDCLLQAMASKP